MGVRWHKEEKTDHWIFPGGFPRVKSHSSLTDFPVVAVKSHSGESTSGALPTAADGENYSHCAISVVRSKKVRETKKLQLTNSGFLGFNWHGHADEASSTSSVLSCHTELIIKVLMKTRDLVAGVNHPLEVIGSGPFEGSSNLVFNDVVIHSITSIIHRRSPGELA